MRTVRGSAAGHPAITATHAKTLEIVRDADIGATASCVVAVASVVDERAIAALRGSVELTISAGGHCATIRGRMNPAFQPGDPLVVRRGGAVTRDAVLVGADAVAADLDRELVAALAAPGAQIELIFSEVEDERRVGTLVVDLDDAWRSGVAADAIAADLDAASPLDDAALAQARGALAAGRRVSVLRKLDDSAATALVASAHASGHSVIPAPGLSPIATALAVAGVPGDRVEFARHGRRKPAQLAPGTTRVVLDVPGDRVEEQLAAGDHGLVALDVGGRREQFLPWRSGGATLDIGDARRRTALVVVHASAADGDQLSAQVARLASAMLEHGMSVRDVAQAVADATDLSRRDAYDLVLATRDAQRD